MTTDFDVDYEEASTLGWPAGVWPSAFEYDGRTLYRLRTEIDPSSGDILYVEYGYDGGRLRVLND